MPSIKIRKSLFSENKYGKLKGFWHFQSRSNLMQLFTNFNESCKKITSTKNI